MNILKSGYLYQIPLEGHLTLVRPSSFFFARVVKSERGSDVLAGVVHGAFQCGAGPERG